MRVCAAPSCSNRVVGREEARYCSGGCKSAARNGRRRVATLTAIESGALPLPAMKPTTRHVLRALIAVGGRGATTAELCQPNVGGIRLSARVYELRELGYVIDRYQERPGRWRYFLRSLPGAERIFDVTTQEAA